MPACLRRLLIVGAGGMLATDLEQEARRRELDVHLLAEARCDITDAAACDDAVGAAAPACVINCAAYTQVDMAERERERAFLVNAAGAENVARACARTGARCVYISTDYVFDGRKPQPYEEADIPAPLGSYGESKLEGERRTAAAAPDHAIVRTSWLYGAAGRNFVTTIVSLADRKPELRIVHDQQGAPTFTRDLANTLLDLAFHPQAHGIFHATNSGACSWYEFACAILRLAGKTTTTVVPITAAEFGAAAPRPANSRLRDTRMGPMGIAPLPPWEDALRRFMCETGLVPA